MNAWFKTPSAASCFVLFNAERGSGADMLALLVIAAIAAAVAAEHILQEIARD